MSTRGSRSGAFPSWRLMRRRPLLGWIADGPPDHCPQDRVACQGTRVEQPSPDIVAAWRGRLGTGRGSRTVKEHVSGGVARALREAGYRARTARNTRRSWTYHTVSVGPTSPRTADDFLSMAPDKVLAFLTEWERDPSDRFGPSPEGLGRETRHRGTNGSRSALPQPADCLRRCNAPTYARCLVSGLHRALREGKIFDWLPVLALCREVGHRPLQHRRPKDNG